VARHMAQTKNTERKRAMASSDTPPLPQATFGDIIDVESVEGEGSGKKISCTVVGCDKTYCLTGTC